MRTGPRSEADQYAHFGCGMTLYAELLGEDLARLPAPLRAIHARLGTATYRGDVEVRGATALFARLCARVADLPSAYRGPIEVEIVAADGAEQWTRRFGAHVMRSRLRAHDGYLYERLGPVRFTFALAADDAAIHWRVARLSVCGLPLPASWFAGVCAVESADGDRYRFDVRAALPGVGTIVHYRGSLDVL
ncbi:MAG: DUF4166 domain-containing protein [Rudaea sp.]|nr:DUF4166 domain-containing protein [Rudaea sp.]